ncbi:MAG: Rieske (2Fe-2S) protein, partial [Planctomycetes bacterium]|nr:Rieske (2Fe-2S) protein [Planctomycetota bacterium]
MFLHDSHLPQLLSPGDYSSPEQHARELETLFRPGWHLVGTKSDLPREGDFLTLELLGYPLLVWRCEGRFQTFLNVCPHRFSRIAKDACGTAREKLRCQYHGWEFDCDGNTRKIPDAQSFKPMTKGALGLKRYRTQTAGQLIFATLSDDAPPLEDYLGPGFDVAEELCSDDRRLAATLDYDVPANWKCKCENSLE